MSFYGLIIGISFVIGVNYFYKKNNLIPKGKENIFIILLTVFSILGARVYGIIANWNYFYQNPLQVFNLRGGGLGIYGGLFFGLLFIFFFTKKNKVNFLKLTNLLVPIVPLCQSIGRFGNFYNHEIYGVNGQPIWFYESILMFILFLILKKTKKYQTAIYLIYYGSIRFLLEIIRTDTIPVYFLTFAQILSFVFILIGIIIIRYENTRN